jgi:hypothetical protein
VDARPNELDERREDGDPNQAVEENQAQLSPNRFRLGPGLVNIVQRVPFHGVAGLRGRRN